MTDIPTGIEPIRAVRAWLVAAKGRVLLPLGAHALGIVEWVPGRPMHARCRFGCERSPAVAGHRWAPLDCPSTCEYDAADHCKSHYGEGCGLYARKHDHADAYLSAQQRRVFGDVLMEGRILEGDLGYQAETQRIASLYRIGVDDDVVFGVAERYDVPVVEPPDEWVRILERRRRWERHLDEIIANGYRDRSVGRIPVQRGPVREIIHAASETAAAFVRLASEIATDLSQPQRKG